MTSTKKSVRRLPKRKASPPTQPISKLDQLAKALRSAKGASVDDLMKITGWQAHSVRGAIAGALKKRGLDVSSERVGDKRIYRIAEPG